jgi:hypothetical protein
MFRRVSSSTSAGEHFYAGVVVVVAAGRVDEDRPPSDAPQPELVE